MALYRDVIFPLLRRSDPETAHERACRLLAFAQNTWTGRLVLRAVAGDLPRRPVELWGLTFPNVIGMAAGFDKDVRVATGLGMLGFGHIEVGTLTPRPQQGNPRPRIFRLPQHHALINRMGFPNEGVRAVLPRLQAIARRPEGSFVLGVSIGKQKETPLEQAGNDYIEVMRAVYIYADYLAVNISSPNTPGLRELQGSNYLRRLLADLKSEQASLAERHRLRPRPLLVKIAPDLTDRDLDEILEAVTAAGIDGIIATNTTLARDAVAGAPYADETGGLSGRPLAERSTQIIAHIREQTGSRLPIIGAGGVFTPEDVREKLDAGASLVQLYTSFIYEGPRLPGRLVRALAGE